MTKHLMLSEVIDALTELSDRNVQERLWLHGCKEGMSSFSEAICGVYDDGGVSRAMQAGELDAPVVELFHELSDLIDRISEDVTPQEIIEHPEMAEVRRLSKELLGVLGKSRK